MSNSTAVVAEKPKKSRINQPWLLEFWHYRELFFFLVWRDVKIRYKQTLLGAAWAIIQPFFAMLIFTLFFGKLAKIDTGGIPYPVFSYCALVPWTYFATTLSFGGNSMVANKELITKVYFPRVAVPASAVLSGLVDFSISSLVLIGMMIYFKVAPSWELLMWPVLVIPLVTLALGVSMYLSSLNVKYRDIKYVLPFLTQFWLFLTPIIYPTTLIPERFQFLMYLNPMAGIIDAFRDAFLPGRSIQWGALGISFGICLVVLTLGSLYFKKTEREFADIV
jgi:lipopolysaccharide transport system permease protein